jgi:transposase
MSEKVVVFAQQRLDSDPDLRAGDLVEAIEARFGLRVHPRSVERALARSRRPKSGGTR